MARTVTGIDLGLRSAKFLRGYWKGNTLHVTDFAIEQLASRELPDGWSKCQIGFKPLAARIGLTGHDVNIRYTRVPRVPDWQLRNLMRFEVEEIGDKSGSGVASDFNLLPQLPEIEGEDVVLLAMARESLLEAHMAGLASLGGKLDSFSPNAIALYNAYLRFAPVQDETVLLANIGHDNIDVVIVRGPDLLFARNLSGGARLFDDAIAQRFEISAEKAREIKEKYASLDPQMRPVDSTQEKASRAILGAAGQVLSLLQSTVLFCKSQIKISGLKLDRVLLCGGGSALHGLTKYLANGLNVPVELFDPFRVVETSALAPEALALLEEHKLQSVVALGLATMGAHDGAYSVELLPEKVKKKREFLGGPVFLIAAGVLATAYLGFDAWRTRGLLERARGDASLLDSQYKKANALHRKAEELVSENQKLAATARDLQGIKGSGEQLARAIDWMQKDLPPEFWITQLLTDVRAQPELGIVRGEEQPILTVVGRAREGTNSLTQIYNQFVDHLRNKLPATAVLQEKLAPNGSKFTLDVSFFAPAGAPAEGTEKSGGL